MNARTYGQWIVRNATTGSVGTKESLVAMVYPMHDEDPERLAANCHVIAAAPELLNALRDAVDALDALTDKVDGTGFAESDEFANALDQIDLSRAVIAKAEGGAA